MDLKRIGKKLFFPPLALLFTLLPITTVFLICSMLFIGTEEPVTIISYILAAYSLVAWCLRTPSFIRFFKAIKRENKNLKRWREDDRLRINASLYSSLFYNVAFAVFQLALGLYHASFWFYSLAGYYISLATMRFFLLHCITPKKAGENPMKELSCYRICGWILLLMNTVLSFIIFFMVCFGRTFHHHEITTIAIAVFTFTVFTLAVINTVKYRKYNSSAISASKTISLVSACVSMLILESTMLTSFGSAEDELMRKLFLGISGAATSVFILVMACYMIMQSNKKIKLIKKEQ